MKPFYLTTPIYYVNDKPHIGHAYTTVAGDVLTRWHRQRGEKVWFLTGTDEHGQKVMNKAAENNVSPQQWCDDLVTSSWLPVWEKLDIANDDFIRTTEQRHMDRVGQFMSKLKELGYIYENQYEGPYCIGCEEFKLPGDLKDGKCVIHDRIVETVSETNWFFKLSAFAEKLITHYKNNPEAVQPESARNEVLSFLEGGVNDLSISRSTFDWGIPVPWDKNQVIYVWFDALLNYATAIGLGDDPNSEGGKKFSEFWPASVHLVGKDILRFHAVIWPAMLMAAGLPTPEKVFAHGWLLVGGEKMSKSKLTGIAPEAITDHFGVDAFRYYFLRAIPFGSDGSFSWEDMSARYTSELANDYGNLAARLLAMVEKYCGGVIPVPVKNEEISSLLTETVKTADGAMEALDFQTAINAIMDFCKRVNLYITQTQPWVVAKDESRTAELEAILYTVADSLRALAVLLNSFMPNSSALLWKNLGALETLGDIKNQKISEVSSWGVLPQGAKVSKGEILFPRLEEDVKA